MRLRHSSCSKNLQYLYWSNILHLLPSHPTQQIPRSLPDGDRRCIYFRTDAYKTIIIANHNNYYCFLSSDLEVRLYSAGCLLLFLILRLSWLGFVLSFATAATQRRGLWKKNGTCIEILQYVCYSLYVSSSICIHTCVHNYVGETSSCMLYSADRKIKCSHHKCILQFC